MQNTYAGDMGDFGKIALLREIQKQGLSIGVNWYLVEPVASVNKSAVHNHRDGKYLSTQFRECDETLSDVLTTIATSEERSVAAIEKAHLIPGARYFSEPVTVACRTDWHRSAMEALSGVNVVFLDPDNGMLAESVKEHYAKSVKYAFYREVGDYIRRGQSVLIYNHRSRKPEDIYFHDICKKLSISTGVPESDMLKITFPRYTVRDYIAVPAQDHRERIEAAMISMEQGIWGSKGVCRIP